MPFFNQLGHLSIKKSHQKSPYMRSVHIGIGHDDDLMITEFIQTKIRLFDACSKRRNDDTDLFALQDLIKSGFFHIENFAFQWQNCLVTAITSLFGRAAGGISLHDKYFTLSWIPLLTIGQLPWKGSRFKNAFAPGQLSSLTSSFTGSGRIKNFCDDFFRNRRIFLKIDG